MLGSLAEGGFTSAGAGDLGLDGGSMLGSLAGGGVTSPGGGDLGLSLCLDDDPPLLMGVNFMYFFGQHIQECTA